jgi:hypothetical protein
MTDDGQIFRAAAYLVDRRGEQASGSAGRKANELFAMGNRQGCEVWRLIRRAVHELQDNGAVHPTIH